MHNLLFLSLQYYLQDASLQEVELEEAIQQVGIHLFLVSKELSLVMVLLANMLNSIARQVNTPTCVIADC